MPRSLGSRFGHPGTLVRTVVATMNLGTSRHGNGVKSAMFLASPFSGFVHDCQEESNSRTF
jgi:hypothetical protein